MWSVATIKWINKYWVRGWAYDVWYSDGMVITYPKKTAEIRKFLKGKHGELRYSRDFSKWIWGYR